MLHDDEPIDDTLREIVYAYVPGDARAPAQQIRARAQTIRRRKRVTTAAVSSPFVVLVALGTLAAASPSSPPNEFSAASGPSSTTLVVPNATTVRELGPEQSTTTLPGHVVAPPEPTQPRNTPPDEAAPEEAPPVVGSPASTPLTSPVGAAPATTPPRTASPPRPAPSVPVPDPTVPPTTPPTTAPPAPQYPPVGAGHTRLLIVLDDTGMHAPGSFSAGPAVEILFVDARSTRGALSYLVSDSPLVAPRWNGTMDPIPSWKTGVRAVQFRVLDSAIQGEVPGSQFDISFIAP